MHLDVNNNMYIYNMNNVSLKRVDVERYLGVIISKNGNYLEPYVMAAKSKLFWVKINLKCKNSDIMVRFYKSLVRPRLEYFFADLKKCIEVLERVETLRVRSDLIETSKLLKRIEKIDVRT